MHKRKRLFVFFLILLTLGLAAYYVHVALFFVGALLVVVGFLLGLYQGVHISMRYYYGQAEDDERWREKFAEAEAIWKAKQRRTEKGRWEQERDRLHEQGIH